MSRYDKGESSKKPNTPGDENERPFKKAKYVWQLKGKYHLKEHHKLTNGDEGSSSSATNEENYESESDARATEIYESGGDTRVEETYESEDDTRVKVTQQNCDENSSKNCSRCLSTLVAHSNTLLELEDDSEHEEMVLNNNPSIFDNVPLSIVQLRKESHDEFLQKWQARQVAKSFIDNTINTILEQWKLAPSESTEDCDNGQVEDEGIMMAIQSHGLQSGGRYPATSGRGNPTSSSNASVARNNYNFPFPTMGCRGKWFDCSDDEPVALRDEFKDRPPLGANENEVDLLTAAITMAIQKKGLSSYSYG